MRRQAGTGTMRDAPSTMTILRQLYWTARKDPSARRHVLRAVANSADLAIRIARRRDGRPLVALALVEHMGDIVAAGPIATAARERHPDARIAWVTREPYKPIPERHPAVDEAIVVGCLTEWHLLWSFGIVDVPIDMHLSGRTCPTCQAAFDKPGPAANVTYQTYYGRGSLLDAHCDAADLERIAAGPTIDTPPEARAIVDGLGLERPYVVVHAKSNEASRDWRHEGWMAMLDHLGTAFDGDVVEIGTTPTLVPEDMPGRRNLCGRLSIMETAEVIRRASLFIGIDSGPAQIANAVGTDGVVLMGDYNGFRGQMPYSGRYADGTGATIVRTPGPLAGLAAGDAIAAVDGRLGIAPPA